MAKKTIPETVRKKVVDYAMTLRASGLPITNMYVFGSTARGTRRFASDIDLCVISSKFRTMKDPLAFLWTKRDDRHLGIEPVGYTPQEFQSGVDPLSVEVKKTGVRVAI